ncbi:MAG TPA: hypothetical protein VMH28_26375 [Candidatus Acidoferrales bacterium]|nr:hypothetical protein [Candidatus Acidoferrales bacterium]
MIVATLIIAVSAVLFAYWFRYSCLLLLRNAAERAGSAPGLDPRFSVGEVMASLKSEGALDPLERALERDYCILSYLIQHAADLEMASVENRLLLVDYRLMRIWSRATRSMAPRQSRKALEEMASVLGVLIHAMGPQAGTAEA